MLKIKNSSLNLRHELWNMWLGNEKNSGKTERLRVNQDSGNKGLVCPPKCELYPEKSSKALLTPKQNTVLIWFDILKQ